MRPTYITRSEYAAIKRKAAAKKARRADNVGFMAEVKAAGSPASGSTLPQAAPGAVKGPLTPRTPVRKPRKAKSERKRLVAQLDAVFSLYIRMRDRAKTKGACVLGCGFIEQCAHLITRAKHSVRWDPRNASGQCAGANIRHEYDPNPYTSWYIRQHGLEAYEALVRDSNRIAKFSNDQLRGILADLKSKMEKPI